MSNWEYQQIRKELMKKPKATIRSKNKEIEVLTQQFADFKLKVRAFVLATHTNGRQLMTIEPANDKGMINGMTIPELVLLVNLTETTGEVIQLRTSNDRHDLVVTAKKRVATPWELM